MAVQLISPHRFKERFLIVGGGGAGKSTATLTIARYLPNARFMVGDTDISFAYDRLLATEFQDVDERGQVEIVPINEWDDFTAFMQRAVTELDPAKDWLVLDDITWSWQAVQSWYSNQVHGEDLGAHMTKLRAETRGVKDAKTGEDMSIKAFNAALVGDMTWPNINKVYQEEVYRRIHKWHGHIVLTAGAKLIGNQEKDEDAKAIFGPYGVKPDGQKDLHRVMATTVILKKRAHDRWEMTIAKDRGRKSQERIAVTEFALDYLRDIAGWKARPYKANGDGK